MKVCDYCGAVFKNSVFTTYCESFNNCPMHGCSGHMIDIDEDLYQSYVLLNEKGYITEHCCSGHSFENDDLYDSIPVTYIKFRGDYPFSSLPSGFMIEKTCFDECTYTCITKRLNRNLNGIELQKQIWETALDVLAWSEGLEYFKDDEYESAELIHPLKL